MYGKRTCQGQMMWRWCEDWLAGGIGGGCRDEVEEKSQGLRVCREIAVSQAEYQELE